MHSQKTDILIVGGGLGGVAAALAATDAGFRVILTEECDWLGGQLTSQAVPPDEHPWIEKFGCTRRYAELREGVRKFYRDHFPLNETARKNGSLNPGGGTVSKLCHLPEISAQVIFNMLAPAKAAGKLKIFLRCRPTAVSGSLEHIDIVQFVHIENGKVLEVAAKMVIDATETGELLPLAEIDWVTGAESRAEFGEPHAPENANPEDVQSITWCFPLAFDASVNAPVEEYRISKPAQYERWKNYIPELTPPWPGRALDLCYSNPKTCQPVEFPLFPDPENPRQWNLWRYRQILDPDIFTDSGSWHPVTLVNWPQNDYYLHNLIGKSWEEQQEILEEARQLSLSFAYWLQNEVPRPDGKTGYPGLYLRPDIAGTSDGLAKAAYIRESRRIKALTTVTECDIGTNVRGERWPEFVETSVGVGSYRMDLHPSTAGRNYVDIGCYPFQIPLGILIPRAHRNLLAGAKNVGTTHITNGAFRLHPVEWNIGEAAGALAVFCLQKNQCPAQVHECPTRRKEYQSFLTDQGIEISWPALHAR